MKEKYLNNGFNSRKRVRYKFIMLNAFAENMFQFPQAGKIQDEYHKNNGKISGFQFPHAGKIQDRYHDTDIEVFETFQFPHAGKIQVQHLRPKTG